MDIIVVKQPDESLISSSFIVQFGIFDIFKTKDKIVHIEVNGKKVDDLNMRIFENGIAYFLPEMIKIPKKKVKTKSDSEKEEQKQTKEPESPGHQSTLLRFNLTSLGTYYRASKAFESAFTVTRKSSNSDESKSSIKSSKSNPSSITDEDSEDYYDSELPLSLSGSRRCSSLKGTNYFILIIC